jgi:hypothetical protein
MKAKYLLLILIPLLFEGCTTPQYAASETCDCLHETSSQWRNDQKADAFLQFIECGQMQEDYRRQFTGDELATFNASYDQCLQETIKGEMLLFFLDK